MGHTMASNILFRFGEFVATGLRELAPQWVRSMFFAEPHARLLKFDTGSAATALQAPVSVLTTQGNATRTRLVDVVLPTERILERTIPIPPTPIAKHYAIAELDLLRRTPFTNEQAYWALGKAANAKSTNLRQWVAKKADIAQFRSTLSSNGFVVRRFLVNDDDGVVTLVDFSTDIAPNAGLWRKLNLALIVGIAGALMSLWLQPAWQARTETALETGTINALREEALTLRSEIDVLDQIDNERTAFVNTVMRRARVVDALRQLTVELPDSVWISDLLFTADQITLNGETSQSAADLVLQLTEGNLGYVPALAGPVSRTVDGKERFGVVFTERGGTP